VETTPISSLLWLIFKFLFFLLAFVLVKSPAFSADFNVQPSVVFLTGASPMTTLQLRNESSDPIRFQIKLYRWDENDQGGMILKASKDLIFFPQLLILDPRSSRILRIGLRIPPGDVEKSYRLEVQQIPSQEKRNDTGLSLLVHVSIPIFILPQNPYFHMELKLLPYQKGKFQFEILNEGSIHFIPQTIEVQGLDQQKQVVLDQRLNGWYLLPRNHQVFQINLPLEKACQVKYWRFRANVLHHEMKPNTVYPNIQESVFEKVFPWKSSCSQ
jgi:fimbrial chaperone protein